MLRLLQINRFAIESKFELRATAPHLLPLPLLLVIRSMQKALLTMFFVCMFSCAGTVLFVIWLGETMESEYVFQFAATCFVIGLATFLSWFVRMLLAIHILLKGQGY